MGNWSNFSNLPLLNQILSGSGKSLKKNKNNESPLKIFPSPLGCFFCFCQGCCGCWGGHSWACGFFSQSCRRCTWNCRAHLPEARAKRATQLRQIQLSALRLRDSSSFGVPIGGQMNGSIWKLKWEPFWDTQLLHLVCVSVYNARMFGMLGLGWQSLYLCFFNAVSIYFGNLSCCLLVWDMVLNLTQSHPVPRLPRPFRVLHFCFPERAHFLHLAGWPLMASRHRKAVLLGISTADDKQPEKTISIHQR